MLQKLFAQLFSALSNVFWDVVRFHWKVIKQNRLVSLGSFFSEKIIVQSKFYVPKIDTFQCQKV